MERRRMAVKQIVAALVLLLLLAACSAHQKSPAAADRQEVSKAQPSSPSPVGCGGTYSGSEIDYVSGAGGSASPEVAVRKMLPTTDTLRVVARKESTAAVIAIRDGKLFARLRVSNFGQGWLVTSVKQCGLP
jgi:hypothetical protein